MRGFAGDNEGGGSVAACSGVVSFGEKDRAALRAGRKPAGFKLVDFLFHFYIDRCVNSLFI